MASVDLERTVNRQETSNIGNTEKKIKRWREKITFSCLRYDIGKLFLNSANHVSGIRIRISNNWRY